MVLLDINDKYKISSEGEVWSNYLNSYLKPCKDKKGYLVVYLSVNHTIKNTKKIHRLVAEYFIPNPENLPQVNHIDGDKTNNKVSNLEWCSNKQNNEHAINTGLYNPKKCGMCKEITLLNTKTNKTETYFSISNFAEVNGYPVCSVRSLLIRNKKYKHYNLSKI